MVAQEASPSFQTLLAFHANTSYDTLKQWLRLWSAHHPTEEHWDSLQALLNNSRMAVRRRELPDWRNRAQRSSQPIIRCHKCGLWLTSAWEYTLHVPKAEIPIWAFEDDNFYDYSICWQLRWMTDSLQWDQPPRIPRFLTNRLATTQQIQDKVNEPYNPVVCSHCKVWVQDPGAALLHKTCSAVCWQARHQHWLRPQLSDQSYWNRHALGLTTLLPRLRALVRWRHAFSLLMQYRYTQLFHAHSLHRLPVLLQHQYFRSKILHFLVKPLPRHLEDLVWADEQSLERKLVAHRGLLEHFPYLRHF